MAEKSLSNEGIASRVRRRGRNRTQVDRRLSYWYQKTYISNMRWSLFQKSCRKNGIWKWKKTSLDFAKKFMCEFWVNSLVQEEKVYVVNVVNGFLAQFWGYLEMFRNRTTLKLKEVLEKLVIVGEYFGFNQCVNEDLGLKFEGEVSTSNILISSESFRQVVKSALSRQIEIEYPPRRVKFVEELLCNLLKVYVKCVTDAVRTLFVPHIVEGKIQRWETRFRRQKSQSLSENSTSNAIEIKSEPLASTPEIFVDLSVGNSGVSTETHKTEHSELLSKRKLSSADTTKIVIKKCKTEQPELFMNTFEQSEQSMAPEPSIVNANQFFTKTYESEQNKDDEKYRELYWINDLSSLNNSIYWDDKSDNIWEENWTRLSFAQRFMGDDWLNTLTEDEKNYVMEIIDAFLILHSDVSSILPHYETSGIKTVLGFLCEMKVHFGFRVNSIRILGFQFKKRIEPFHQVVSFEKFRRFMKTVPLFHFKLRSGSKEPIRLDEFLNPFISKLLYIQVRCIVDGIRKVFNCRFENRKIRFEQKADVEECRMNNEEQWSNEINSETDDIGSVDVGNVKEEVVDAEEEEAMEQKPTPSSI